LNFAVRRTIIRKETNRIRVMSRSVQTYEIFETDAGWCGIAWNDEGIVRFTLPSSNEAGAERLLLRRLPEATRGAATRDIEHAIASAKRYFAGEAIDFSGLKLDLGQQDPFFARVYDAVRTLGWGETTTYGAVAKALGAGPEAARDVGQAMAGNPIPLIIPCHRVLAAGNKIGGFSAPGGSDSKRRMLEMEGVELAPPKPVQQQLAL
jgi:methylated-DNA-[protein]-cysteine S-methyltransferase